MVDFSALLSKPADEIKRPPALPAGTYKGIIKTHKFDESSEKKTPYVRFDVKFTGGSEGYTYGGSYSETGGAYKLVATQAGLPAVQLHFLGPDRLTVAQFLRQ